MTPLGKALLVQFDLSDVQRKFLQNIAPSQLLLKDALALPNVGREEKAVLIQTLMELNILSFQKEQEEQNKQDISPELLRWLEQMEKLIEKRSYFEILGLHWICINQEIEQAFSNKKRKIEASQKQVDRESKIRLDTIEQGIQKAYNALQTSSARQEYRRQIFHLDEIKQAANELAKQGKKKGRY